ncbi:MAG: alpha/beta fold hydrolase [Actinomycetota bacterium]|nr:alpha/beta fold hydrolase [Actinomycetota bacterium]
MDVRARLLVSRLPSTAKSAVIVLHGGASRRANMRVSPTQLSVLRMIPVARRIAREGRGQVAVFRLLNSVRGWDTSHTPVDDVRWALERVRREHGLDVPVCLVGHSLGGRAAILSAGHERVRSVVALAPFVYPEDGRTDARGHEIVIIHGTNDRIAPIARAEAVARLLRRTTDVGFVRVIGGKHAMLRHHRKFDGIAAATALATLTGHANDAATPALSALRNSDTADV